MVFRLIYNLGVRLRIELKRFIFPTVIAICGLALTGASCKKDGAATDPDGLVKAIDAASAGSASAGSASAGSASAGSASAGSASAGSGAGTGSAATAAAKPLDRTAIPGVDVSKLPDKDQTVFFEMVDSLPSPCGKAHSLRTSITTDKACRRAPFAVRYLLLLLEAGAPKEDAKELYDAHYNAKGPVKVPVDDTVAHFGAPDAAVKIVEFFDYGCPHCKEFTGVIKESIAAFPNDVVIYFRHYVLGNNFIGSDLAAQGAVAAAKQGKFLELHELLFAKQSAAGHSRDKVFGYAKSLGLDMKQFATDFDAAKAQVAIDHAMGEAVGVESTPAIFINGRDYKGPAMAEFMKLWIEEELAVNR